VPAAPTIDPEDLQAASGRADEVSTSGPADEHRDADGAFELAMRFVEEGRLPEAEEAFAEADRGGHAIAALNLGILLEEHGDVDGAEAAYRRADDRGDARGAFNLAMVLDAQDRPVEARHALAWPPPRGGWGPSPRRVGLPPCR